MKCNTPSILIGLLCVLGIGLILGLSWQSNPNLQGLPVIPQWLYHWTDDMRNARIRTAVPFFILAIIMGFWFCYKKVGLSYFFIAWLIFNFIVFLAEFGQYFIPSRDFDFFDILWGSLGSLAGLVLSYLTVYLIRFLKG